MLDILNNMPAVWAVFAIVFILIEAATMGLTTIWFAAGAVAAMIAALAGGNKILQIGVFLVVSLVLLIFTRKIFIEKLKTGKEKTNTEAVIGEKALVTEEIRPHKTGTVLLVGKTWTAACRNREAVIEKGIEVKVVDIEGVKAIVDIYPEKKF